MEKTPRPMPSILLSVSLGALFGLLAAASAYIILYREYSHHFVDASKARLLAFKGALAAFLLFVGLSAVVGFVIAHFVIPPASG